MIKSPFPGMDPFLEPHWTDIHQRLVVYSCDQLQPLLPPDLRARTEERVWVEGGRRDRSIVPDVLVARASLRPRRAEGGLALMEPEAELDDELDRPRVYELLRDAPPEGFVKIVDARSERVVTVLEFLSATNKGAGAGLYAAKQRELLDAGVNLVEVDLLRAGHRVSAAPEEALPPAFSAAGHVCVSRAAAPGRREVYLAPLDRRLPTIAVPLRPHDPDVRLALQPLIERCYANGRYDDLDYSAEPVPPLAPDDARLARDILARAGRRPAPAD